MSNGANLPLLAYNNLSKVKSVCMNAIKKRSFKVKITNSSFLSSKSCKFRFDKTKRDDKLREAETTRSLMN